MAKGKSYWLVTGRYLPTDAEEDPAGQEQSAADEITTEVCKSKKKAKVQANFYYNAKITRVEIDRGYDWGGSTFLCGCSGIDTGRHADTPDWRCPYLTQFRAVS